MPLRVHDVHPNMSPSVAMRNCGGSDCFLGNESRSALTGTHCRFGEVERVYGEESEWHRAHVVFFCVRERVYLCVCVCVCATTRFHWPGRFWAAEGPDNGECQAMWIMDVGL